MRADFDDTGIEVMESDEDEETQQEVGLDIWDWIPLSSPQPHSLNPPP